jgi:hypothetical protein
MKREGRILVISCFFLLSDVGVHRVLGFIKNLVKIGWDVFVLGKCARRREKGYGLYSTIQSMVCA